jgi:arylsulfatase A-like enzyme
MAPARPNLLLLITDQQRAPQHWPQDPGWLADLTPNDEELKRTGVSFERAFCASAMCSPSRASFLTGTYPSRHGVTLTLSQGDMWPEPRNTPAAVRAGWEAVTRAGVSPGRVGGRMLHSILRRPPLSGNEPELPAGIPTLATRLREQGYHVVYKGKWHLTKPVAGGHDWGPADTERLERDFGFAEWEPPDAGENAAAEHFGGGNAGTSGQGWDEDYIRGVERFLAQEHLPEPFCLVVSLVNPHDVLGYPDSFEEGGFRREDFAGLGVPLPPTLGESLRGKPTVQSLARMGLNAYLGPLKDRQAQKDYVDFYAHLHAVVDEKIGRLLRALGDASDPASLRSRTVIARMSDHGEMGLSHGGARQKVFNAYEETIRVPLVVSNPLLFPDGGARTDALASLVDIVPTFVSLAGGPLDGVLDGRDLTPVLARHARPEREALAAGGRDFAGVLDRAPADTVRETVLFTYDDHQAATAQGDGPGQPNRIRAVRDGAWKYAVYVDPYGQAAPEFECYDLEADPNEALNAVDVKSGEPQTERARAQVPLLKEQLLEACAQSATHHPPLPA